MSHNARRCSARRKDGRPCRAWAVRDSEPARCASHRSAEQAEQETDDFNESDSVIEEAADRPCKNSEENLTKELRRSRTVVRRLMKQLRHELDADKYARLSESVFKGNTNVADIMRAQQALSDKARGGLPPEYKEAIEKAKRKLRTEP